MTAANDPFPHWFKGDEAACDFAHNIWNVSQSWDDMLDEGKSANINNVMQWIMFKKDDHPFFADYARILTPAMLVVFLQWQAANTLEKGGEADVEKAYMLRGGIYSLYLVMAWIIGGNNWAAEIGPEIYRAYGETLTDFKKEMEQCQDL